MRARDRFRNRGRRESGPFTPIPHAIMDSPNWRQCSGSAIKVLLAIARQFNGHNNGDLCASFSILRERGIRSPDTLHRALRELQHFGMIQRTRQGGLHAASLYGLTWLAIDECSGKLDVSATRLASGSWKEARAPFKSARKNQKASTESVQHNYEIRTCEPEKTA